METRNKVIDNIAKVKLLGSLFKDQQALANQQLTIDSYLPRLELVEKKVIELKQVIHNYEETTKKKVDVEVLDNHIKNLKEDNRIKRYDINQLNSFELSIKNVNNQLALDWRKVIDEKLNSYLAIFNDFSTLLSEKDKGVLGTFKQQMQISSPFSSKDLQLLEEYASELKHLLESFELGDIGMKFLKQLTKNGFIEFNNLDQDTINWIKSSKLASKIRVTLR